MLFGCCINSPICVALQYLGIQKDNMVVLAMEKVNSDGLPGIVVCCSHMCHLPTNDCILIAFN